MVHIHHSLISSFLVLYKFPLVELDISNPELLLCTAGIENSETLILEPRDQLVQLTHAVAPIFKPFMVLREIPDDNSCLFNAVGYVLENLSLIKAQYLRDSIIINNSFIFTINGVVFVVVAEYILARPKEFTDAVLGREPIEYARWIRKPDKWGGAIELSIFSDIYGVEIGSFDVQTGRMDLFGEGRSFNNRVYLQYSGIHYEAFALVHSKTSSPGRDQTIFSVSDILILEQVRELVQVAQSAHRFTDMGGFTLRCNDCGTGLKGEIEAQKHAQLTGHANFVEF